MERTSRRTSTLAQILNSNLYCDFFLVGEDGGDDRKTYVGAGTISFMFKKYAL